MEQSWAYGEAVAGRHGWQPRRTLAGPPERPEALAQILERPILGGPRIARLQRGPLWIENGPQPERQAALFRSLRDRTRLRRGRLLFWMPALPESAASHATMEACGLRRVVTGYTTAWLDLSRDEAALRAGLHGKWRNALKAAETGGLAVRENDPAALDWLLEHHDRRRKRRRLVAPDAAFYRALASVPSARGALLTLQVLLDSLPVSGALLIRHGLCATYAVGWSGAEGRRHKAQTLALWHAVLALKRDGLRWLDLGGLTPDAPGVARFKLGLGPEPERLVGTYL